MAALVASLCILIGGQAVGEETSPSTNWTVTAGGGVAEVASRDEAGSPLAYSGVGYPLILRVDAVGPRWAAGGQTGLFVFGLNGGRLSADLAREGEPSHRADSLFVDLSAWIDRQVLTGSAHRLWLGAQVGHWTFFRSYLYNPAQIGSVESWEAVITADVRAGVGGDYGRLSWELAASVPLLGWMMRPSYAVRGDERVEIVESHTTVLRRGRAVTVDRLQMVQGEASVALALGQRWGLRGEYRAGRLSYTNFVQTRAFVQRGTLGVSLRF